MLYTKVPGAVMARSMECTLDTISEMSGNWFAVHIPAYGGWVYLPAPKIVMGNDQRMKMFWPAHPSKPDCPRRIQRTYFAMAVRPEKLGRWLRVTHFELGGTRLPALDLPTYLAEVATHGPHQANVEAEQLAAQLQTVTLDGPAGAGANEAVPVAAPVAGPMDV